MTPNPEFSYRSSRLLAAKRMWLVCLCALLVTLACSPSEPKADTALAEGAANLVSAQDLSGFPAEAKARAKTLLSAAKQAPNDATKAGQFAMLAHSYGSTDLALRYYRQAAELDSKVIDWPYLLGVLLSEQGENTAAIDAFEKAALIDAAYPPMRLRVAQLMVKEQRLEEAERLLKSLVLENPGYAKARWAYGQFALDRGDSELAIEQLNFAIADVPHYGSAHYALAAAYKNAGDTAASLVHTQLFNKYRNSGPASKDSLVTGVENLRDTSQQAIAQAARLSGAGQFEQAIGVLEKLLKTDPDNADAHINLIGLYGESGQIDKAEMHYRRGLEVSPDAVKLHNNFGVLRLKQKQYAEAAGAFRVAIDVDPDYATSYKYLGLSLKNLGETAEAKKYLTAGYEKDPLDYELGYLLGSVYLTEKNYPQAVEVFEGIVEVRSPKSINYLRALAKAHYFLGDFDSARDVLTQARSRAVGFGQAKAITQIDRELEQIASESAAK